MMNTSRFALAILLVLLVAAPTALAGGDFQTEEEVAKAERKRRKALDKERKKAFLKARDGTRLSADVRLQENKDWAAWYEGDPLPEQSPLHAEALELLAQWHEELRRDPDSFWKPSAKSCPDIDNELYAYSGAVDRVDRANAHRSTVLQGRELLHRARLVSAELGAHNGSCPSAVDALFDPRRSSALGSGDWWLEVATGRLEAQIHDAASTHRRTMELVVDHRRILVGDAAAPFAYVEVAFEEQRTQKSSTHLPGFDVPWDVPSRERVALTRFDEPVVARFVAHEPETTTDGRRLTELRIRFHPDEPARSIDTTLRFAGDDGLGEEVEYRGSHLFRTVGFDDAGKQGLQTAFTRQGEHWQALEVCFRDDVVALVKRCNAGDAP